MSIGSGDHGEHGGTLLVAGDATVGELRWFRAIPSRLPCFGADDMRALLTDGSHLSVT